jgi:hypothetical protein
MNIPLNHAKTKPEQLFKAKHLSLGDKHPHKITQKNKNLENQEGS